MVACYIAAVLIPERVLVFNVSDFWKRTKICIFFCLKLILINSLYVEKDKKEMNI